MSTYLIDPALLKMSGSSALTALNKWCSANDPSLFLSMASQSLIAAAIEKASTAHRQALRTWFDEFTARFSDRFHAVDSEIFKQAGVILPQMSSSQSRHRLHDAILVATARVHGHTLVTRRDSLFTPWMKQNIQVI